LYLRTSRINKTSLENRIYIIIKYYRNTNPIQITSCRDQGVSEVLDRNLPGPHPLRNAHLLSEAPVARQTRLTRLTRSSFVCLSTPIRSDACWRPPDRVSTRDRRLDETLLLCGHCLESSPARLVGCPTEFFESVTRSMEPIGSLSSADVRERAFGRVDSRLQRCMYWT
jgi:hypothetical protein